MTRFSRTSSQSSFQLIAVFLMYSFVVSLPVSLNRIVRAAPRGERDARENHGAESPVQSPGPEPTPEPSTSPTPEPVPTMTPTSTPSPTQTVPVTDLQNLDGLRIAQPEEPEVPEEVPSTRCSPGQPDCDPTTGAPVPPGQAIRLRRTVPARRQFSLSQDQLFAWADDRFSTPFLKYDSSREATDTSVNTDSYFSPFEPVTGGDYDDFVMARLDPDNRTGSGGEDILSRNFSWNLPLVEVVGRAGLNLGLSLSYNSLVWTRSGSYITFDADNGFPTPGFRLGFPVVYGQHYNSQTGTYGFLVLTPSGGRVELRRVGSTNVYEAADSSYLQLTDNGNGTLLVRSTDGTQLSYSSTTNGYRCTQVKDRNGNYLTITNSSAGRMLTITDTLGRVFNFNYDNSNNLTSISQTRGSSQYTWVTFGYTNLTLQANFTGLTIIGTQSGTTLPVLKQVGLPDGTYYKFSYSSWGQVYKITNFAADSIVQYDSHPLNYISYNLPLTSSTAQTDCPRFTQRKEWAENWNNSAEVVTNYAVPSTQTWTMPGGSQQTGTFCQIQTPDGVYQNVYLKSSGWDEGLPVLVNTYDAQIALQRQVTTSYTQDNTGVSYILNPRVSESNIYDPSGNHKRTAISYSTSFGLPTEVREYAADATSVLRTTQSDYGTSTDYSNRRIIGLPTQKRVYDTANGNALVSKVDFVYDDSGEFLVQQGSPIQHDTTNYGSSFIWRGNLTKVKRWDVINTSQSVEARTGYNTTGSPIFTRSPLQTSDTQANLIYTDSFSDGQNRNTYAYPTEATIKDTVGTSSSLVSISNKTQYSFDAGAATRTEGPPPSGQSQGAKVTNAYDSADRLYLTTNTLNGAYVYTIYPASSNVIQTYTTIQNTQTATVSAKLLDGAGRVRATAAEHPGSTGGYVGQITVYDVMGQMTATSNPTEIYGSWQPAGDDAAAGWVYSYQTYDWKGRPKISTNQDGTTREATYGGCGCAGGEIVTVRDEVNRYSKVYHDVLGRVTKSEQLNADQSIYRTSTNIYNARDQVTSGTVQQGTSGSGQTTTMTYDGFGRLSASHAPIQSTNTVSSRTYNADDSIATTTDARGVVAIFTYNNRHLTTSVSYPNTAPSSVPETASTSFTYDAANNRTSMTDGLGSVSYQFDQLSRMTSESRTFTNLGMFTLSYGYNLAGLVTSVTDPWSAQIGYTRDVTGRLTAITGSGYSNVSQTGYASEFKYRAWGVLKSLTYGNGVPLALTYTNRMQVSNYKLTSSSTQGQSPSMDIDYTYAADGQLKLSTDHRDATLDRAYKYDQIGRLTEAFTASEARSWVQSGSIGSTVDGPYRQSYTLDPWDNMTSKWGRSFTAGHLRTQSVDYTYSATTGRNNAWVYDADGRMLGDVDTGTSNTYDEAGGLREVANSSSGTLFTQDGEGQKAKMVVGGNATHYLRSSLLGQTIAEIDTDGSRKNGFVHANGELIATQAVGAVFWQHMDASQRSRRTSLTGGNGQGKDEVDPMDVKLDPPGSNIHNTGSGGGGKGAGGTEARVASLMDLKMCDFGGMLVPCSIVGNLSQHVGSLGEQMIDHWNGITTWNITVTAKIKYTGFTIDLHPIKLRIKAGLFSFKPRSITLSNFKPEQFTENFAIAAALGIIRGDDEGIAKNGKGDKDDKEYKRYLNEDEWASLEDTFNLARQAIGNSDCAKWLTSDVKWNADPLADLNTMISLKHFFYGGEPNSIATTYPNEGGSITFAWIGLRALFFKENRLDKVDAILHELRHAIHLGSIAHPENFKNDAEKKSWLLSGGSIESQARFNRDVEKNCIGPLRRALRGR